MDKNTSVGLVVLGAIAVLAGFAEAGLYGAVKFLAGVLLFAAFVALWPSNRDLVKAGVLLGASLLLAGGLSMMPEFEADRDAQSAARVDNARARERLEAAKRDDERTAPARAKAAADAKRADALRKISRLVTLSEFQTISEGMTYDRVVEIIGSQGELTSSSAIGRDRAEMYTWKGSGSIGANMNAMFQNGRMISKAQFGLE
jgi:hypothetical protein